MRTALSSALGPLLLAGCMSTGYDRPAPRPSAPLAPADHPSMQVVVHQDRQEIEVLMGPMDVPPMTGDHHAMDHGDGHDGMYSPMAVFSWPVDTGLKGFRLAAYDAQGRRLPRDVFHHVIGVHFDRRQLVYPVAERLFGFGSETPDIRLPGGLVMPVASGDSVGLYAMWNNTTGETIRGVYMQVLLPYADDDAEVEHAMPVYFDTNNNVGGKTSFDLAPGVTTKAYEFTVPVGGGILAASGHLHDYGRELRIENAESGDVLFRLHPETGPGGEVVAVEQRIFRKFFMLLDDRVRLEPGVRYRVVGEYLNPTDRTIPDGGMAHVVGLFVPDDLARWPGLDRTTSAYQTDVDALPPRVDQGAHRHTGKDSRKPGGPMFCPLPTLRLSAAAACPGGCRALAPSFRRPPGRRSGRCPPARPRSRGRGPPPGPP